jgi:hypothetical protein
MTSTIVVPKPTVKTTQHFVVAYDLSGKEITRVELPLGTTRIEVSETLLQSSHIAFHEYQHGILIANQQVTNK